jgi:hypothetical protein
MWVEKQSEKNSTKGLEMNNGWWALGTGNQLQGVGGCSHLRSVRL